MRLLFLLGIAYVVIMLDIYSLISAGRRADELVEEQMKGRMES